VDIWTEADIALDLVCCEVDDGFVELALSIGSACASVRRVRPGRLTVLRM
jgi:hypothetical protein